LNAHKITSSPNDLAAANVVKIIECQFEAHGQDIEVLQSNSRAAVRYIADVARKYAVLFIKKQQRTLRNRRSADRSPLNHETLLESHANPLLFAPNDLAGRMMSVSQQDQGELIGDPSGAGNVERSAGV
jgi:hypothetical protein